MSRHPTAASQPTPGVGRLSGSAQSSHCPDAGATATDRPPHALNPTRYDQEPFPLLASLFMLCSPKPYQGTLITNPPPTETATPALDRNLIAVIVQASLGAIPHHPDATPDEQDAVRQGAFTVLNSYQRRDPQEAMLAAHIAATQFHIMDDLRCAAQCDLPSALKLRHRRSAATLTRMKPDAQRDLMRRQAYPAQNPATPPPAIPRRPLAAPVAAVPRPAPGGFIPPTEAEIAELVAQVEANLAAQTACTPRWRWSRRPRQCRGPTSSPSSAKTTRFASANTCCQRRKG